ncbi:C6 zinc finger domain protein [Talaromyces proteolyticus]|uniref:C6 zinc finger domain protein n=1 Tax=Talaromyces proteolyticus TaxID=1131652 RepID=A0AAD4Q2Y2_9EURO|nr:C6 zinc finger domain protein [Talaromyces proteolyticus]KAH8700851.1 C6 zinc finger domain protein [Talaromyces proteolyticus]
MVIDPSARSRRSPTGHLKSRHGCKTCKIRKVKCGEEKPHCIRCTSTGRKCEYDGSVSILDNPLSLAPNTVWRERRSFAYYFQHAATLVGGELDVDFWSTIVPQVCRSEPAVWDAIIAISALFESPDPCPDLVPISHEHSRALNQNHRDALYWYSRSVSAIRQRIEDGRLNIFVGLITCILFMCIEALQGSVEDAIHLYSQGVRLILDSRAQMVAGILSFAEASLIEDTIVPIFIRLGAIALPVSGFPVHALLGDTDHELIQELVSLKSAREALVLLGVKITLLQHMCDEYRRTIHTSTVPQELINKQTILSAGLRDWLSAYTKLMDSLRTKEVLTQRQMGISALLFTYHEVLFIITETCLSPSQIITDSYIPNFRNIVEHTSISLDALARSDGTQPPFTFEINVGYPLWFTCLRCRDPKIRRTSLALLRRAPQLQGLHKSHSAVSFGERVMVLEERYGMAMKAAQEAIASTTPEPTNGPTNEISEYQSPSRTMINDVSKFDLGEFFAIPESEFTASQYPTLMDLDISDPTAALIPEEARLGPIHMFRPRDGFPPGTSEEDIAKWNRRDDQVFLRFTWTERDVVNDTWHIIHEYIPIAAP